MFGETAVLSHPRPPKSLIGAKIGEISLLSLSTLYIDPSEAKKSIPATFSLRSRPRALNSQRNFVRDVSIVLTALKSGRNERACEL